MRLPFLRSLRLARALPASSGIVAGGAIAALTVGERLLGPLLVQEATFSSPASAIAVGAALSTVFAVRGAVETARTARTEAVLYVRVVEAALRRDVLGPGDARNEDPRAALFEGGGRVARLVAEGLPNLFANTAAAGAFALLLVCTRPLRVVLVAAAAGALGTAALFATRKGLEAAQENAAAAWALLADRIGDAFDGQLELVAGGRREEYAKRFESSAAAWTAATRREAQLGRWAGRLPLLALAAAVGSAVMLEGALRGEPSTYTLGEGALLASMAPAFIGVVHGLQELMRSTHRLEHLSALVVCEEPVLPSQPPAPQGMCSVELRGVHFAYERGGVPREALRGVSLTWRAGEVLALAGPNGSGKSTCLRLILGLSRAARRQVTIDGLPLDHFDPDSWRRMIAFLPQRPYLPPRSTVRDGLRFLEGDVEDRVMARALERVGFSAPSREPAASPLDALVDELSVGQRQRVGLARILCRAAPMVILDEPDANLDDAGIQIVAGLLRELATTRMVLVAAHAPEILASADRVLTLEEGKIVREFVRQPAAG